jgi:hypothetical protein
MGAAMAVPGASFTTLFDMDFIQTHSAENIPFNSPRYQLQKMAKY